MFSSQNSQVNGAVNYIEDVFSTYLYTGNDSTQTITNNIDLATKGGLTWIKCRSIGYSHAIFDTARGAGKRLLSNSTTSETTDNTLSAFTTSGFTVTAADTGTNNGTNTFASWTFRKQPKFFDVVAYTGNGAVRNISHSLGSVPGCIIIKCTTDTGGTNWIVYHRSLSNTEALLLNSTAAKYTGITAFDSTTPTSTVFTVAGEGSVNASGESYVAYIFAHDAGGFGLTGTDNVISCGSSVGQSALPGKVVTLGYEPQFVMVKQISGGGGNWFMMDTMRGMANTSGAQVYANLTNAEAAITSSLIIPTATGFIIQKYSDSDTFIYIAIRRGPMKVPTDGTKVFGPIAYTGDNSAPRLLNTGFVTDLTIDAQRTVPEFATFDRLRGSTQMLNTCYSSAENTRSAPAIIFDVQNGVKLDYNYLNLNTSPRLYSAWNFKRAPSFFDVVCYTGNSNAGRTVNHNLGVVPELMIIKRRDGISNWPVYSSALGNTTALFLDTTDISLGSPYGSYYWNLTSPTSSVFTVDGTSGNTYVNGSGYKYIAYLFASCPGVSKIGTYIGNGSTQTINCGFTSGARFVLIKTVDSEARNWWVWDTARGIVSSTEPFLALNTTSAEASGYDDIDPSSNGFTVNQDGAQVNTSGYKYLFLAIA